ncbi:TPR domain-containing protein [Xylaria sp. FL0064]|nr:TPR domain-containing protein [Xylaria sp. FL0064]
MADLEEAIQVARQAVETTPEDHLDRATWLNNLGIRLSDRYSRTGAIADLEESIQVARQAVETTPEDHPDRAIRLNNLGSSLRDRYLRTGAMADLEEAIQVARQAVEATPEDHPDRVIWLNNLGSSLGDRYSRTGAMADLEEAIQVARQAVEATPEDHLDRATWLNNLGSSLRDRYSRTGDMADLEEAIQVARQAVEATPEDHPDRAIWLNNLGIRLSDRYSRTGAMADLEEAYELFLIALHLYTSPISFRITSGRQLLTSSLIFRNTKEAHQIAQTTIQLIPLLAPRASQNTDKQHLLLQVAGLASDAAAISLQASKNTVAAIEMLETGRSILTNAVYDLRTDVSALQQHHPMLAETFISLRDKLDVQVSSNSTLITSEDLAFAARDEANQRREANKQLDALIEKIRAQPGFERFLLPPSKIDMQKAATDGPIVVVNVSSHRCDALIIELSDIRTVALPQLSQKDIESRNCQSLETLPWLWDAILCPVLDVLGFTKTPSDDCWPHVWWIPTGPLVRFPLHAAGNHLNRVSATALDRVISSYSSSIKAIIHARQQQTSQGPVVGRRVTLVAMEETPGQASLRFASEEINVVRTICESIQLHPIQPELYKRKVLSSLETSWIFHFAGHGGASSTSPLHSQLLLRDWAEDALTVQSLLETNISSTSPFLAYLSACGTGENRNEDLADEGIHLTAACQLAGFRHVIGTLWSVDDSLCVDMASSVSGLHYATRELRDRWVQEVIAGRGEGSQGLTRLGRDGELVDIIVTSKVPHWIPFVHYGL